jgi:hypothetical protein
MSTPSAPGTRTARAYLLYEDFLLFLEALVSSPADPWDLYQFIYLNPNRAPLEAWWEQCIGRPREVWIDRARAVRPEDYGALRAVVQEGDLMEIARDAMARCRAIVPLTPEPEIYFLVGFFSPDGFTFSVNGKWAIGIGMERLHGLRVVPILLAHEYGHCYRRSFGHPETVGQRLIDEGFAIELSVRAFPERPRYEHLLMRPGQLAALRQYEPRLWTAIAPIMPIRSEELAAQVIYGRGEAHKWPSRAGVYLGWRMVQEFLDIEPSGFDATAERVIENTRLDGVRRH